MKMKFLTNAIRGISALTNNQINPATGALSIWQSNQNHAQINDLSNRFVSSAVKRLAQSSIEMPPKPKKPITPWIMFVRDTKDSIISRYGKISAAKLSVILSREWKESDKTPYQQRYQQLHDDYKNQLENFMASLSDQQLDHLNTRREAKREIKSLKLLRKTNPPPRPRNKANFYCQDRVKQADMIEYRKTHSLAETLKKVFEDYRSLSEEQKKKYEEMELEDKGRFQHEFLCWYEEIQCDVNLPKSVRDQANAMRERLKKRLVHDNGL